MTSPASVLPTVRQVESWVRWVALGEMAEAIEP